MPQDTVPVSDALRSRLDEIEDEHDEIEWASIDRTEVSALVGPPKMLQIHTVGSYLIDGARDNIDALGFEIIREVEADDESRHHNYMCKDIKYD